MKYDFNFLPENIPLYKDSGLLQLRTDDMEDVILQQGVNESDNDFVKRIIKYEEDENIRISNQ